VEHQPRQKATRKRESGTNLLGRVLPEVQERLDVELLRVEDALDLMSALLQVKQKGIPVRIILPLEHDPGFPGRLWDLEPYITEGIDIRWGPAVFKERLVADGRHAYRLDGESLVPDPELATYPLTATAGTIEIFSGEVVDKRTRDPGLSRLDRLLFVRIWALDGQFPVYFSSVRTSVDALRSGDRIKVLCAINWSGSGLFSAFAPSALYYEGVDFKPIARPEADA
jgi:hypothetical protein